MHIMQEKAYFFVTQLYLIYLHVIDFTFTLKSFSTMPPKAKANGEKKARAPPKRKLAEEFPPGEVLTDNAKKRWKLGQPVGKGGFGLLYLGK